MRYYHQPRKYYTASYGITYYCDHPVYDKCTLYTIGKKGLCVIQQRYIKETKATYWGEIDPWLIDEIYVHDKFKSYFDAHAAEPVDGFYPTVSIRQLMWGLKMKPIPRERWETCFDRKNI